MKLGKTGLKGGLSTKSLQIDKNQSAILIAVVAATIVSVFCLTSAKVLLNQALYQRRVINARNTSVTQLNNDIKNANSLTTQYNSVFLGSDSLNIIGGNTTGSQPQDGDNGKVVLDALPTTYDFPALLTSLSNLMTADGVGTDSIGGSDQSTTFNSDPTYNPQPTQVDLTVSGATTYDSAEKLLTDLERSIRPFDVTHVTLSGNESELTLSLDLSTFYQPAKTLSVPSKEIK